MEREAAAVVARYARRSVGDLYSMLRPDVWMPTQERDRRILQLLRHRLTRPLTDLRLLEVGCGHGANLLEMLRIGFAPGNLVGVELLTDRVARARTLLPSRVDVHEGDALHTNLDSGSFDIVYLSLVFSSLLDFAYREKLASRVWEWVRPGGAVLWYDFIYDNPSNPYVRGVTRKEIKLLFPSGRVFWRRVTLAPPIARCVARIHPSLYTLINVVPWFRTHLLCWIEKR